MSRRGRAGRHRSAVAAGLVAGALAAGAARAAYTVLGRRPPGGTDMWTRTNHRGESLTLLEGPALAVGTVAASALASGLSPRLRGALVTAGAGAAVFGACDDLAGSGDRRGFRGHLGALAHGEVTTGAVKLGGIGATGLAAAALLGGDPADVVINAGLVAGGANLVNLFDLRPGRAIKVALAGSALLAAAPAGGRRRSAGPGAAGRVAAAPVVAAPVGAALALLGEDLGERAMLGEDLGERAMLGDAGANALGALLGVAAAVSPPRAARVAVLAGVVGLTAASEKVSFTAVIERTPALKWLDMLGRRPAPAAPVPGPVAEPPSGDGREAGQTAASPAP